MASLRTLATFRTLASARCAAVPSGSRAASRAMSATTFDGDMARLYLNFFNQAESAWNLTEEIVADTLQITGSGAPEKIVDVASGPGEPALTLARAYPGAAVLSTDGADAMVELAKVRFAETGLGNLSTAVMVSASSPNGSLPSSFFL